MSWLYSPLLPGGAEIQADEAEAGDGDEQAATTMTGLYHMIITVSDSFTRPANTTAYDANDLVANSTSAVSVEPLKFTTSKLGSGRGIIRRVRLFKDSQTETQANFSLHLFVQSPAVTNGDGGAFAVSTAQNFLGTVSIDMSTGAFVTATDMIEAAAVSPEINFDLGHISSNERRIYGLIQAIGTYTPASGEVFEVTLEIAGVE